MFNTIESDIFKESIKLALREDLEPFGDITSLAFKDSWINKNLKLKVKARNSSGIMSGLGFANWVYTYLCPSIKIIPKKQNGESFKAYEELIEIEGSIDYILKGERIFLNLLQRAISIATYTNQFVQTIQPNSITKILDTRKTTPCFRELEKAAVRDGGGLNHRYNLATGILIKDNHIAALGGNIELALKLAKEKAPYLTKIEIEIDSFEQLERILKLPLRLKPDIVLLDNFEIVNLEKALKMIDSSLLTEVSGGVNLTNIKSIADLKPDFISIGSLTQNTPSIDIGLDFLF